MRRRDLFLLSVLTALFFAALRLVVQAAEKI